jgi:FAD/FMN-containing dehydrogenase
MSETVGSTDPDVLAAAARDYGNIVRRIPRAVVLPENIEEVVEAIRYARRCGARIAARGQGHSTDGQAQAEDGIIVDMSALRRIEHIGDDIAVVQAGATWRDLLAATIPRGCAPPVLTGYTGLSVGGTLSMGGVGGASFREGVQVDHAIEVDVVTGVGELVTCSATANELLFDCVRGGVGQYGIIVRATLRTVPTPARVRQLVLTYASFEHFFADLDALASRGHGVDGVYGQVAAKGDGWSYIIHAVRLGGGEESDRALLRELRCDSCRAATMDRFAHDTLVDAGNEQRARAGLADLRRIWQDAFLPAAATGKFVADTLRDLSPRDLGPAGFVLLFPIRNRNGRYALRLPAAPRVYLFDVLTSGEPDDAAYVAVRRAAARLAFERARSLGGTLYPIGSTPMSPADWAEQFGPLQSRFRDAKSKFDPDALLAPGARIFAEP